MLDSTPSTATLSVLCPSNASIGLYSLFVKTGSSEAAARAGTLTVLFNPWCNGRSLSLQIPIITHVSDVCPVLTYLLLFTDDWVFLADEAERQEYVMNEQGIVYKGVNEYIKSEAWDFGQVR